MDREELERRIAKKESDVENIEKRIQKWNNAKSEAGFIKEYAPWYSPEPKTIKTMDELIQARFRWHGSETEEAARAFVMSNYEDYLKNCDVEIRRAQRDMDEAKLTLEKYRNALIIKDEQSAVEKIPVIVEFLNKWKKQVENYITLDAKELKAAYEFDSEICDKHNSGWYRSHPEADERADYRRYREMMSEISPITREVYSRNSEDYIDHEKLKQILDKEAEARYFKMVNQVTKYTGPITDASNLRLGVRGDIEGIVTGEKGKARVNTIGAGGYNQNYINPETGRHGQIYHYRTLVAPIRN